VNRIQSCVVLTHIPTGIQVRSEETRYQAKNEEIAWKRLEEKLKNIYDLNQYNNLKDIRANQIGEGERSDKRRTYREKDNLVIDHITGKKASWKDIMKGKIELLF
jgi:peptide chain release factor 1